MNQLMGPHVTWQMTYAKRAGDGREGGVGGTFGEAEVAPMEGSKGHVY